MNLNRSQELRDAEQLRRFDLSSKTRQLLFQIDIDDVSGNPFAQVEKIFDENCDGIHVRLEIPLGSGEFRAGSDQVAKIFVAGAHGGLQKVQSNRTSFAQSFEVQSLEAANT